MAGFAALSLLHIFGRFGERTIRTEESCNSRKWAAVFGTTSVQLNDGKNGLLIPKRHQSRHLECSSFIFRDQGVGGSNPLSPSNLFRNLHCGRNPPEEALCRTIAGTASFCLELVR